jgi:hypothetical protein
LTWKNAVNYCQNLELDGYSDWRLPSKTELESLTTKNKNGWLYMPKPFIANTEALKGGKYNSLTTLSITKHNDNSSISWIVNFNDGNEYWNYQTSSNYAICVRDSSTGSE